MPNPTQHATEHHEATAHQGTDGVRRARLRTRLAAGAVDVLAVGVAVASVPEPFPPLLPILVFVLYHAALTWWLGRTIGKALLRLRVRRPGKPITAWWSLARSGPGYLVLGLAGLGLLTARYDPQRRALYDIVLGGLVVQERPPTYPPAGLWRRLIGYAEEHEETAKQRKGKLVVLAALWAWLSGWAGTVEKTLDRMIGREEHTGSSALSRLSAAAASRAGLVVVAASAAVFVVVPAAEPIAAWLVEERHWLTEPEGTEPAKGNSEDALRATITEDGFRPSSTCLGFENPRAGVDVLCYGREREHVEDTATTHIYSVGQPNTDNVSLVAVKRGADGAWAVDDSRSTVDRLNRCEPDDLICGSGP